MDNMFEVASLLSVKFKIFVNIVFIKAQVTLELLHSACVTYTVKIKIKLIHSKTCTVFIASVLNSMLPQTLLQ